ncbi:unnamed protein product [Allacma fusca]|uniref:Sodium-dependent phosphate transport protein 2B n=1 Tax=Allacma fusca TaxID=39272 RepID=A0A8J2P6M1_9HEXA|nr:unnamed protein product [Allacma fusca]
METIPESETDSHSFSEYDFDDDTDTETENVEKHVRFEDELSSESESSDSSDSDQEQTPLTSSVTPSAQDSASISSPSENTSLKSADSLIIVPSVENKLLKKPNGHALSPYEPEYKLPQPKYMSGPIMRSLGNNERGIDVGPRNSISDGMYSVPPIEEVRNIAPSLEEIGYTSPPPEKNQMQGRDDDEEFYFLPLSTTSPPNISLTNATGVPIQVIKPEKTWKDRAMSILMIVGKTLGLLFLLYMFVCSLDLLSLGFRLIGGRTAGEIFRKSDILQNPVVGVMIGILTTVLVQSSSTSTSIIVGMVSAGFLQVQIAIPIIMGANIGTSITNTIVSFSQAGDREQFRLAFAGATILDMFNWIAVIVLLPLEVVSGFLYYLSDAIMKGLMPDKQSGGDFQLLSIITKPFVNLIVQLDRNVLECWSSPNCTQLENSSLIREYCNVNQLTIKVIESRSDGKGGVVTGESTILQNNTLKCDFIFAGTSLSDAAAGVIILIASLLVLCTCLILIVKLLSSVLQGQVANVIKRTLNADIPYVPWITGYLAILVGAVMTFLVQSSSVFTSAITPLIGLGVITVDRAYPLTLGSNIGTTTTALLASMAVEGKSFFPSMQIALCHLLFNITGILLFYPIPYLRFPIGMAKYLGKVTSKYRWFAILYMVVMFAVLPAIVISLSLGGPIPVIVFCSIIGILFATIALVTLIQRKRPSLLPERFRTWKWLPLPLRSLQPYDDFFTNINYCKKLKEKNVQRSYQKTNEGSKTGKETFKPQILSASPSTRHRYSYPQFADDEV